MSVALLNHATFSFLALTITRVEGDIKLSQPVYVVKFTSVSNPPNWPAFNNRITYQLIAFQGHSDDLCFVMHVHSAESGILIRTQVSSSCIICISHKKISTFSVYNSVLVSTTKYNIQIHVYILGYNGLFTQRTYFFSI